MLPLSLGLRSHWPHGAVGFAVPPWPNTCVGVRHREGFYSSPVRAQHAKEDMHTAPFDEVSYFRSDVARWYFYGHGLESRGSNL